MDPGERSYANARELQARYQREENYETALAYGVEALMNLKELFGVKKYPINKKIRLRSEWQSCLGEVKKLQELVAMKFRYLAPTYELECPSPGVEYPEPPQEETRSLVTSQDVHFAPNVRPFKTGRGWVCVPCIYCDYDASARLFEKGTPSETIENFLAQSVAPRHPCLTLTYGQWAGEIIIDETLYTFGIIMEQVDSFFEDSLRTLSEYPEESRIRIGKEIARGIARILVYIGRDISPCASIDRSAIVVGFSPAGPVSVKLFDNFGKKLSTADELFKELGEAMKSERLKALGSMTSTQNAIDLLNAIDSI